DACTGCLTEHREDGFGRRNLSVETRLRHRALHPGSQTKIYKTRTPPGGRVGLMTTDRARSVGGSTTARRAGGATMIGSKIGTREEWLVARDQLLEREKEHTRLGDESARQRRELPWVAVDKEYRFDTEDGEKTLAELFDGRAQLLVYHFMF